MAVLFPLQQAPARSGQRRPLELLHRDGKIDLVGTGALIGLCLAHGESHGNVLVHLRRPTCLDATEVGQLAPLDIAEVELLVAVGVAKIMEDVRSGAPSSLTDTIPENVLQIDVKSRAASTDGA